MEKDYRLYQYKFSELIDQIIKRERLPKNISDQLINRVHELKDDCFVYYKEYPYMTPLIFTDSNITIDDIFELRIKNHIKDCILVLTGISVDPDSTTE